MNFNNIHQDINHNCIDAAFEDTSTHFIRKLKTNELKSVDFVSHWEQGWRKDTENPKAICKAKGVSVDKITKQNEDNLMEIYQTTFRVSPGYKKYYCKFRFKKNAGKIKESPSGRSRWHHSFYKCDQFNLDKIDIIEISPIPVD